MKIVTVAQGALQAKSINVKLWYDFLEPFLLMAVGCVPENTRNQKRFVPKTLKMLDVTYEQCVRKFFV